MIDLVRIANASGFWGDRLDAASELLRLQPDLDYLTLDLLAEVSMSILALQRQRDPQAGYVRDLVTIIESLAPYWRGGGRCRLVTNGGGLDPLACATACQQVLRQHGCGHLKIAVVQGDDVLRQLQHPIPALGDDDLRDHLDSGQSIEDILPQLITANAYIGGEPIASALRRGADIVITGRCADPSLTVGPCMVAFDWSPTDWDRLAGATVAGHLIECGTQLCGGITTDWMQIPNVHQIGFPIAEIAADGSCTVTKANGSGGQVNLATVKEQLLYETGDPGCYLSPDVTVSIVDLQVTQVAANRVQVTGARGRAAPTTLKVSATYQAGYRCSGQLTVHGQAAADKAYRIGTAMFGQLAADGIQFEQSLIELIGTGACDPRRWSLLDGSSVVMVAGCRDDATKEVTLRITVGDTDRTKLEHFSQRLMAWITAGPAGTTGYAEGRPRVRPWLRFWPCLIDRQSVCPQIDLLKCTADAGDRPREPDESSTSPQTDAVSSDEVNGSGFGLPQNRIATGTLIDIAHGRSGDKGENANIGVIARDPLAYDNLARWLTAQRVARFLKLEPDQRVRRYRLPNLAALNFVIAGVLENSLRLDAQGKTLAQILLQMPLPPEFDPSERNGE